MRHQNLDPKTAGIFYTIAAYTAWGFLPLYWKLLINLPVWEIWAHRMVWSSVFVAIILLFYRRWNQLKDALLNKTLRLSILASALLISANWFIYIWAVNMNHVIDASLGYYINPLLSIFLGMIVLRERLNFWQLVSILLAAIGVLSITFEYGRIPWIAISLASTFALYGLAKKLANVDSMVALALETFIVLPVALIYLIYLQATGAGSFTNTSIDVAVLLMCAGIATVIPLFWFAQGAIRVPLTTIGFIQYLSPSISLLLGVFVFKEPFTSGHGISFGFIWSALALYTLSRTNFMNHLQPKTFRSKHTGSP